MLLLHGFGGSATNWFCVMESFGASFRVIAIDQMGFGASGKPKGLYSADYLAQSAHAFMRKLKLGPAVVMGASMGGDVAARLAARWPGDVAKLVLVDSSGLDLEPQITDMPRDPHTLDEERELLIRIFASKGFVTPALVQQRLSAHLASHDSYTIHHWGGSDRRLEDLLPAIKAPTLVVWGADDPIWPPKTAGEYVRRIRNARIAVIPNAGHTPYLERPEVFAAAVVKFLASS
jgi:pimeloyl-ACP methyl ester carboxylesterase